MFDAKLRPLIDPPLNALGRGAARLGIGANMVTLAGMIVGIGAGWTISQHAYGLGLILIGLNRLLDGLDGAIARATAKSDFGGYLDIVCDYVFYVAVPLGFGFADPANLPFAMGLIAAFTLTGVSFLTYALLAAQRGETTKAHGEKSFFYSTGLAEGAETIIAFALMGLFPHWFAAIASGFAALCVMTVFQRSALAYINFRKDIS
jgi:phosphatidylglycerophosphate synthase